jgi:hypothetical protein
MKIGIKIIQTPSIEFKKQHAKLDLICRSITTKGRRESDRALSRVAMVIKTRVRCRHSRGSWHAGVVPGDPYRKMGSRFRGNIENIEN